MCFKGIVYESFDKVDFAVCIRLRKIGQLKNL